LPAFGIIDRTEPRVPKESTSRVLGEKKVRKP